MTLHEHYEYNDESVSMIRCRRGIAILGAYKDAVYPDLNLPISATIAELLADLAAVIDGMGFAVKFTQDAAGTSVGLSGADPTLSPDSDQIPMLGTPIDPGLMAVIQDPEAAGSALVSELTAFLSGEAGQ